METLFPFKMIKMLLYQIIIILKTNRNVSNYTTFCSIQARFTSNKLNEKNHFSSALVTRVRNIGDFKILEFLIRTSFVEFPFISPFCKSMGLLSNLTWLSFPFDTFKPLLLLQPFTPFLYELMSFNKLLL